MVGKWNLLPSKESLPKKTGINHVQIATNMENAESFTIFFELFAYHKNTPTEKRKNILGRQKKIPIIPLHTFSQ